MRFVSGMGRIDPQAILLRGASFAALWWVLAEGRADGWLLGAVAVALSTWTSWIVLPPGPGTVSLLGLSRFMTFFVWNSLRGGVQVAAMALRGRATLRPALLELPITLPPGGARVLLLNALGLMPGTLGVELAGETLRLHVLDERLPVVAEARALEAAISKLCGGAG
jgi:multicomponent Na+:H+ antiporter subunit E